MNLIVNVKINTEEDQKLIEAIEERGKEELKLFEAPVIKDLIKFKWTSYACYSQYLGFTMHMFYILSLTIYI